MRKNKENDFAHKFRLLNSQECTDDINWSLSSSNDEECYSNITSCNQTNQRRYTKRKRKRKAYNITNLDISVIETMSARIGAKSPILCDKNKDQVSPVLKSKLSQGSPILAPRSSQKSPILHQNSVKVSRKLFKYSNNEYIASNISANEVTCKNILKEKRSETCDDLVVGYPNISKINASNTNELNEKKCKHYIYKNVKNFFDNHFTSDNASQNSISDVMTPQDSVQSDEIEISSGTTDQEFTSIQKVNKSSSEEKFLKVKAKKTKYKNDGLAFRLNVLLKKQKANRSLWQHEKFLADNSNFVLPKEEHLIFRVKKAECEYGCTFLYAVDENDLSYCIVINNMYLYEKIVCDSIVKIYKPFTMLDCGSHQVVLNVYKYDHLVMKIENK